MFGVGANEPAAGVTNTINIVNRISRSLDKGQARGRNRHWNCLAKPRPLCIIIPDTGAVGACAVFLITSSRSVEFSKTEKQDSMNQKPYRSWEIQLLHLACLCAMCASPIVLHAQNGINMVSQSYSVSFQWNETWSLYSYPAFTPYPAGAWSAGYQADASGNIAGGYNASTSGGSPLTASCLPPSPASSGGGAMDSESGVSQFSLYHSSGCVVDGTPFSAPLGTALFDSGGIRTSTQGIWDFHPIGVSLNVHLDGVISSAISFQFEDATVQLTDKTTSTTLLSITPNWVGAYYTFGGDYPFAVDPSHLYEFSISEASSTFDLDNAYTQITASLASPVPEPSLLNFWALLGGVSLIRLTWLRRSGHLSPIC